MTQNRIICFRIEDEIEQRISRRLLGGPYSTRSRFLRTAMEMMLAKEEGKARLQAAQMEIRWG